MSKIVLCDIDGTVANNDHRQHLLKEFKDWDLFFEAMKDDDPIIEIIALVNQDYINSNSIVFITGRPERYRAKTRKWLSRYFDFKIKILMRSDNDQRNKLLVKQELVLNFEEKKNIYKIYENDLDIIDLWKKLGFFVEDVNKLLGD
ncbi:hypothetical protein N9D45_04065 [Gammaproteobacteria bacterium]|nr:hypothetical protein [Gammaproteobacteria bacterium]